MPPRRNVAVALWRLLEITLLPPRTTWNGHGWEGRSVAKGAS